MPGRTVPLVTNEIYHVFNRGINRQPTFTDIRECKRVMQSIAYYRFFPTPTKLSYYLTLPEDKKVGIMSLLTIKDERIVEILGFCIMPNHFHFLLRQVAENGISKFMGNLQNSYTRYFNTKNNRDGSIFLDQFKAVRIETDEQLLHVCRYIHLNPLTAFVVKDFPALIRYQWSSLPEYLGSAKEHVCETKTVLGFFKNIDEYKKFVDDQVDYQQELHQIKHLLLEE